MLEKRPDTEDLALHFPATFGAIRAALTQVVGSPVVAGLSALRLRDLELVLAEALNNVAEHAYALAPGGEVRLSLSRRSDSLLIAIRDQGVPMPAQRQQILEAAENSTAEGGRGWLLIHALCRSVKYERLAGTNRLMLEFVSSD